jgi:hypothetical protein
MPHSSAHESPTTVEAREARSPVADERSAIDAARREEARLGRGIGWYVTFLVLAVALFVAIDYYTGLNAVAATARFLWNALAVVAIAALRAAGGLLALLAKGVGWRRLSRIATALMGVGLSYSGGVLLSEHGVRRAKGWTGKLRLLLATLHRRWLALNLGWKLAIVATLIASQIYLHFLLIVFPIAFLVPVVRKLWVQAADVVFGRWYWKALGRAHRATIAFLRRQLGVRHLIGTARLVRIRYLCAWRLWRYDPRYRCAESGKRQVSFLEPIRLWRRGELDSYVGRPLLGSRSRSGPPAQ